MENVALSNQPNELEPQIATAQGVFITRDGAQHDTKPTVAEDAYMPKLSSEASGRANHLWIENVLGGMAIWMYTSMGKTVSTGYFFGAQGNLIRLLRMYPVCQIPIVLASVSSASTYYN